MHVHACVSMYTLLLMDVRVTFLMWYTLKKEKKKKEGTFVLTNRYIDILNQKIEQLLTNWWIVRVGVRATCRLEQTFSLILKEECESISLMDVNMIMNEYTCYTSERYVD